MVKIEREIFYSTRLVELVEKHEASLEEICYFLHINIFDMQSYMNGSSVPDGPTFKKITLMFNIKPEFLCTRDPITLTEFRWFYGLSLPQAGKIWGISPSQLHKIEEGKRNLTQRSAKILSTSLKLPIRRVYELAQGKTTKTAISDTNSRIQEDMVQLLKDKGILSLNFRGHLSEDILADMKHLLEKLDAHTSNPQD